MSDHIVSTFHFPSLTIPTLIIPLKGNVDGTRLADVFQVQTATLAGKEETLSIPANFLKVLY